ncbi:hypothetical protein UlMin_025243 [Ulmus minor]
MKWPPWLSSSSKKFEVIITVRRLEGIDLVEFEGERRVSVEIQWKGHKGMSLRRSMKRKLTKECFISDDGVVEFEEEFSSVCNISGSKDGSFYRLPLELAFTVFHNAKQGWKNKATIFGMASVNLAEYASFTAEKECEFDIPLKLHGSTSKSSPSLSLSVNMLELNCPQDPKMQESSSSRSLSPRSDGADESAIKAGLRRVKTFTSFVSARRSKKYGDGTSDDSTSPYPFDIDSPVDNIGSDLDEKMEDFGINNSVSYESLALANTNINGEDERWIYYSHHKSNVDCKNYIFAPSLQLNSRRMNLPWRKRKFNFSRAQKIKGEPLLKKHYEEEGGDDIDYDRRQLSSSDDSSFEFGTSTNRSSVSEFGDDTFAIGSWESKEVRSRDGLMKLQAQVFFASIDQRNERAAGHSACTALVAVIADWLQSNGDEMPIKSDFDCLIRDGSSEWRNLCEKQDYKERFPDKHFDLETILQAKIRPLIVVPDKSFVGFFHPEELQEGEGEFDFLQAAMSFDSVWDEISRSASEILCNGESSVVYIVSWNDHFFVLKVEQNAYYIIDTLGERLYEGCNEAYVLKFDEDTIIETIPKESDKLKGTKEGVLLDNTDESRKSDLILCKGKESCRDYIKNFLAAIPIRELRVDIKKGLTTSTTIHHRLQIEFHYTKVQQPDVKTEELHV